MLHQIRPTMIKRILIIILIGASIGASGQLSLPTFEVGAGLALRHTEGFYIPRFSLAGHKIFKGLGLYMTYEQRNNAPFADDFNADGNYQRYLVGPTLYVNPNIYVYGGISPFGPYGLGGDGGFGKKLALLMSLSPLPCTQAIPIGLVSPLASDINSAEPPVRR